MTLGISARQIARKPGEARQTEKRYDKKLIEAQELGAASAPSTSEVKSGLPAHDVESRWPALMDKLVQEHKRTTVHDQATVSIILVNSRITSPVKLWALFAVLVNGMPVEWTADQFGLPRRALAVTVSDMETKCREAEGKKLSAPLYKIGAMAAIEEKFPYILNVVGKWTVDCTRRVGRVVGFDKKTHRYRVNFNSRIEYLHDDNMVGWSLWDTYEQAVRAENRSKG